MRLYTFLPRGNRRHQPVRCRESLGAGAAGWCPKLRRLGAWIVGVSQQHSAAVLTQLTLIGMSDHPPSYFRENQWLGLYKQTQQAATGQDGAFDAMAVLF